MNKSETIGALAKALSKVQGQLRPAIKDAKNPFFKSNYADLNSVWDSCRQLLTENGLSVAQLNKPAENGVIIETLLMHESGEWISGEMFLPLTKQDAQSVGSAVTYGRRYGLAAVVGIVADEDDDANAAQPRQGSPNVKQMPAAAIQPSSDNWNCSAQLKREILDLEAACESNGVPQRVLRDRLEVRFETRNPATLTPENAGLYRDYLKQKNIKAQEKSA